MTIEKNSTLVAVIGEGKMGSSIFFSLLNHTYSLRWIGSKKADLEKLRQSFEKKIRRALKSGIVTQEEYDNLLKRTVISSDLNDASDCDLVIEAIPEDLLTKQALFRELDTAVKPSCILASNSSSISPSKLFTGTKRDERIIGIHYFYPVLIKEWVELIITPLTTPDVIENVVDFLQNTGKYILELNESNCFILNKIFLDIQNESYHIVEQGKASVEQIDKLVKEHLFLIGIFDFMDSVGIDTMLHSVKNYISSYPHRDTYSGLINRLQELVDAGKLGMKSDCGFYDYQNGQLKVSNSIDLLSDDLSNEIILFLKFTYLSTAKRFTMLSGCTVGEMNQAIREYLGLEKGPFE